MRRLPSKRLQAARALSASQRGEALYARGARKLMRAVKKVIRTEFEEYLYREEASRVDAKKKSATTGTAEAVFADNVFRILSDDQSFPLGSFSRDIEAGNVALAKNVTRKSETLGVNPFVEPALAPIFADAKDAALGRIKALAQEEVQALSAVLEDVRLLNSRDAAKVLARERGTGLLTNRQWERLAKMQADGISLDEIAVETKKNVDDRADLIARDQALTTNSIVSQQRMESAGVESFVWVTSRDQRVRDNHQSLDGQVFRFDNPPVGGGTGESEIGLPGSGINCRCTAYPIVPELEDDNLAVPSGARPFDFTTL